MREKYHVFWRLWKELKQYKTSPEKGNVYLNICEQKNIKITSKQINKEWMAICLEIKCLLDILFKLWTFVGLNEDCLDLTESK